MRKIIFYGASVTNQSKGEGYFEYLQELFHTDKESNLSRMSFPACHFNDAGFLNHKNILEMCPDIVVYEWNTTGLSEFNDDKINSVILSCLEQKIIPAFLILPRVNTNLNFDRNCEKQIINICNKYSLPMLDLRNLTNIVLLLRDDVHTNEKGAREYAAQIFNWINSAFRFDFDFIKDLVFPKKIQICQHNLSENQIYSKLILNLKIIGNLPEIVIVGNVGPYSPILSLSINGEFSKIKKSIWDPWCYYEREMTISLTEYMNFPSEDNDVIFELVVLSEIPDYTQSRDINFEFHAERYLNINKLYLIDLQIN